MYIRADMESSGEATPAPPEFIQPLHDQTVADGGRISLDCYVTGSPRPYIAWFHESSLIQPSTDFAQFYDADNFCSLIINDVFPEDAGKYTVVAKNPFGTVTCCAQVAVRPGIKGLNVY